MQIFGFWGRALPEIVRLREGTPSVIACGDATFPKGTAEPSQSKPDGFASSPEGGALFVLTGRCKKAPPSGELANAVSLRGFVLRQASSPSQSSPIGLASSPKGRASGETASFAGKPGTLPPRKPPLPSSPAAMPPSPRGRLNPLSHGLRRASSPEGGALLVLTDR